MNNIDLALLQQAVDEPATLEVPKLNWSEAMDKSIRNEAELLALEIPPREFLIEPFFKVGDFGIISAQRGVGKTWLGCVIARGIAQGTPVGEWKCPKARRVMVADGEMPLDLIQERYRQFGAPHENLLFLHHQVVYDHTGHDLDLTIIAAQEAVIEACQTRGVELLILDNQSTLLRGVSESEPDSWNKVLPCLLKLQRLGIAALLIVHAGRNNQARGHSRREDRTSWMISLSDRKDENDEGAKFVSEFTKPSRVCPVSDTPSLLWEFKRGLDGKTTYTCSVLSKLDQFRQCLEEGMGDDPASIAEEMKVSSGYVSKLAAQAAKVGWCAKSGRGYGLVSKYSL